MATYVTQKGDTLYTVADRFLRDPSEWKTLARINHVAAPRVLPPGFRLLLPVALLRQEMPAATVVATSGPAQRAFHDGPYVPLIEGAPVTEGDSVRTGADGFATLELPDGSHVHVPPQTELSLTTFRRTVLTGVTDRVFALRHGRVENEVTHATRADDRFQIRSPSVVAGVRGTDFRVNYDSGSGSTAVEVIEGAVGVDASSSAAPAPGVPLQASTQLVNAHYGSVTGRGGAVGSPVPLLAAPTLVNGAKVQDNDTVAFDVKPVDGAVGYRAVTGRDAGLVDTIRDVRSAGPHIEIGPLDDDTYFLRVTAISAQGLEGMPGTYAFERRRLALGASGGALDARHYRFRWSVGRGAQHTRFRFVLAADEALRTPLVDRTDIRGTQVVVSNLEPGVYYWSVIAEQFDHGRLYEKATPVQSFRLEQ